MKRIFQHFSAVVLLGLMASWGANAQTGDGGSGDSGLPLSPAKTIKIKNESIPPVIPGASGPINPSDGSGTMGTEGTGNRPVMWVHGHGGNGSSWDKASAATQNIQVPNVSNYPPRKVVSYSMDYSSSSNAISAAASFLKTKMETLGLTPPQKEDAIVISHSMGGLVSSYVDYLYDGEGAPQDRTFHGLVTVGTPHLGAPLAQNAYPYPGSMANDFANNACNALVTGPVVEKVETSFWLDLLLSSNKVAKLTDQFCSFVADDLATVVLKSFNAPIANDLKPNSQLVNTLQGFTPQETHRLAFYGVLPNTDLIWRTYHYMKNGPNADGYFEADKSQQSVDVMNDNKAKYVAKRDYWLSRQNHWQNKIDDWCPWAGPACLVWANKRDEAKTIKNAYQKGVSWWYNVNDDFRLMMGDIAMGNNPQASCECTNYNSNTGQTTGPFVTMGNNGNCTGTYSSPNYQFCNWVAGQTLVDVDSDGIVPASSAMALPGASNHILMQGDSHFQLVNSPRLKSALTGLWNSGHGDSFFITPPK